MPTESTVCIQHPIIGTSRPSHWKTITQRAKVVAQERLLPKSNEYPYSIRTARSSHAQPSPGTSHSAPEALLRTQNSPRPH